MSIQRLSNAGQSGFRYKSLIAGITPVPSVPTIGTATALTYSTASVEFTAPGAYAGSTYTATSSPGGYTGTSASSPITVSGLSGETSYTFTVTATNATGTSGPSAASNSITTPPEWSPEGAYDALATVTVPSGGAASIDFVGIPTGYKHLQIRSLYQGSVLDQNVRVRVGNSSVDTASNYNGHYLYGYGAGTGSGSETNTTSMSFLAFYYTQNNSASFVIDCLDYSDVNKYKTFRSIHGNDSNGLGQVGLGSGLWRSTSAINQIQLYPTSGSFNQYSSFALYGVK